MAFTLFFTTLACVSAQNIFNGNEYTPVLISGGISWEDARAAAIQSGGHLVTIESQAENDFIYNLFSADDRYWQMESWGSGTGPWIGLQRAGSGWEWITGKRLTFANWAPSEPNQLGSSEDDVAFSGHSPAGRFLKGPYWGDIPNGKLQPGYILEKEGIGSTMPSIPELNPQVIAAALSALAVVIAAIITRLEILA